MTLGIRSSALALLLVVLPAVALADDSGSASGPAPYSKFITGATVQNGLLNVIRKDGKVFIEIAPSQLGQDFIQTAEQRNGLGGYGSTAGGINALARLIRFTKSDSKIFVTWPNSIGIASGDAGVQRAINQTFADSPVAVAPIVAEDATSGHEVFDASFLLGDLYNMASQLKQITGTDHPEQAYHLDPDRTVFGTTKAFPDNVVIDANQTWASDDPEVVDNVPDPRTLLFDIAYNITAAPANDGYMPRLADDRVGFFDEAFLNFGKDSDISRAVRYVIRWDMRPTDSTASMSPARHPMIYYLENTIPEKYKGPIRRALLAWNPAFEKIGISNAIQVRDQPDDPNWDPDDVRYNTILWMTESNGGGYAAENPVFDPRTGQMIRTNIIIDADVMNYPALQNEFLVDPARSGGRRIGDQDRFFGSELARQAAFGRVALEVMGHPLQGAALQHFNDDLLQMFIMHESGHGMGLQHNFIGSYAYSAKQLQDPGFTSRFGVASSVMEYSPINLWPKPFNQGNYWQTILGPYDNYAIHWGYARIPGARTPQDEVPTLSRWASAWSDPRYRFESDEDVDYPDAHAIDPRVSQFDLSNDPLSWNEEQLKLSRDVLSSLDGRWPRPGHPYDEERIAFAVVLNHWFTSATQAEHYIGGEFLSRARPGDPGATPPLVQVPRVQERRAFDVLDHYLLGDSAWTFSPKTLNRLVYSEWETQRGGAWAYNPQPRHDEPIAEIVENVQQAMLNRMFHPLMIERIVDMSLKAPKGSTMSLTDLFDWTQRSIYGDLSTRGLTTIDPIHRSLQQWYARKLATVWLSPQPGTPFDGQSMARHELVQLKGQIVAALHQNSLDEITRAHLENLQDSVTRALDTRQTIHTG